MPRDAEPTWKEKLAALKKEWEALAISYEKWRYEITLWIIEESLKGLSKEAIAPWLKSRWPERLSGFFDWYRERHWPENVKLSFYEWFVHRAIAHHKYSLARFVEPRKGRPNILGHYALLHLDTILCCRPRDCFYLGKTRTIGVIRDLLYRFDGTRIEDKTLRRMLKDLGYQWDAESGWEIISSSRATARGTDENTFQGREVESIVKLINQTRPDLTVHNHGTPDTQIESD
jgi:hypothetical protein